MTVQRFFFAWVDAGTAFNPSVHNREDEKVMSFQVEQVETEFANLTIDIRNPRIGLLATGRKLWAWLSYHNGSAIVPLFFGRLVAIPSSLNKEVVQLSFIARPTDYAAQKAALAATLRVMPYWDPVFLAEDKILDPDAVLEGRTQVWHINRTSHVLTVSDLVEGEDGLLEFEEGDVPYDSVSVSLDQPPVRAVHVEAKVTWEQVSSGEGLLLLRNWKVDTLAGKGFVDGFPKAGTSLKGGWHVTESSAASRYAELTEGDWASWYVGHRIERPPFYVKVIQSHSASVSEGSISESNTIFAIISDEAWANLTVGYECNRKRSDTVTFTLVADSQPIVTMPEDNEHLDLKISGNDVGLPLNGGAIPIGDVQRRSYFTQSRGQQSLQYLIQLARANIIVRSRAVKIGFKCSFEQAVACTLRKNAQIWDPRLPGGTAIGKIVGYTFKSDGGEVSGTVSIASCIGYGGSWEATAGAPVYVVDGYVANEYQYRTNERIILGASDVGFERMSANPNDDGLVFPLTSVPLAVAPHNVTIEEKALTTPQATYQGNASFDDCGNTTSISMNNSLDTGPYTTWLGGIKTTVNFSMKGVDGGPFDATYALVVTDLKLPKQIDLEAPLL